VRRRLAAVATSLIAAVGLLTAPTAAGATATVCATTPAPITALQLDRAWSVALPRLLDRVGPGSLPFGATGRSPYVRTNAYAWTSGFFPTSLWLAYERTGDSEWRDRARRYTDLVLPIARWRGSHDLGFMVGLPAGLGARLDPERAPDYARARQQAARSLSTRWNARVGAIRSATYAGRWGLIIDSAMNAPLLIEVGRGIGGAEGHRLERRGLEHMRTLARTFVRPDGSTFHRQAFDPRTGRLLGPIYGQGLSTRSTWARGQAWAVNGFTQAYAVTGDEGLLAAARATADHWIDRVSAGCVPAWDLDVTDPKAPLDSSAAAILVDGLLQLADVDPDAQRAAGYRAYALTTLATLADAPFVSDRGRGVLLRQTYNVPADRREGSYAWGDAYLLSALARAVSASSRG
jgi:unsaturated chondroitin disaccharide hydrolase